MATGGGPITFFDVETTGLSSEDRIVSIGLVHLPDRAALAAGEARPAVEYLIFNPGRPSHPRARQVHGFADDLLAGQDPFAEHAKRLAPYFSHGGPVVAHNVSFDRRFVAAAFAESRTRIGTPDFTCTMLEHRRLHGSPSGLDAVLQQMGRQKRVGNHGALRDAFHAAQIYCWLQGWPIPTPGDALAMSPLNLRAMRGTPEVVAAAQPAQHSDAFAAALQTLEPLATIMVRIASADGNLYQAEIEALSLLMHTTLAGMPGRLAEHEYQDLLAALIELPIDDRALQRAARAIVRSREMREAVAGWVRAITFADGTASAAEHAQIVAVTEALAAAKVAILQR